MSPISEADAKRARLAELLARRTGPVREYPTSFGQQRLWFLDRLNPGGVVYNMPMGLRLRGPLHVDLLRRCLQTVVDRHAVLRTTFPGDVGGQPVQRVTAGGPALTVVDLGGRAPDEHEADAMCLAWQEARTPFDLGHGPLFRTLLVRIGDDDHVLVLNLHHTVSDAWSQTRLLDELATCYAAYLAGTEPVLPELPVQYGDFAVWQRERATGGTGQRQLAYWTAQLAQAPARSTLPTDRPRPPVQSYRGALHRVPLPGALTAGLRELNRSLDATLFMTMLAALQALLSRYTGQTDIVVGSPVDMRTHAEVQNLIGFFANTVALRTSLADDPTFRDLVARVREVTLDALDNADVPFERLVKELQPERTMAHAPVFQVQLIVQNTRHRRGYLGEVELTPLALDTGTAKFDLTLAAEERAVDIALTVEYATDLFEAPTVVRFAEHLTALLAAVIADPDLRVSWIPLASDDFRRTILAEWNSSARPLPVQTVPELLAPSFARYRDRPAVVAAGTRLSYADLATGAQRLANLLRTFGVGPDVPVGICLDRSAAMVTAALATWQAGGGYLPLDPGWPVERLRMMLDDAQVPVVLTDRTARRLAGPALSAAARVLCLDDEAAEIAGQPATAPVCPATGDHLAYLLYTSGSTGRPKGVAVTHRSVVNVLLAFADLTELTPADRWGAQTTLSFDISVVELFVPVLCGASVVVISTADAADGAALRRRLAQKRVTALQATPATWRMLQAAGGIPAGVRLRLAGGERLTGDLAAALRADGVRLWNAYGPTETTVWSAVAALSV